MASDKRAVELQAQIMTEAVQAGVVPTERIVEVMTKQAEALAPLVLNDIDQMDDPVDRAAARIQLMRLAMDALEFKKPKLARIDHKVEGEVKHGVFVAVERREEPPLLVDARDKPNPDATE